MIELTPQSLRIFDNAMYITIGILIMSFTEYPELHIIIIIALICVIIWLGYLSPSLQKEYHLKYITE